MQTRDGSLLTCRKFAGIGQAMRELQEAMRQEEAKGQSNTAEFDAAAKGVIAQKKWSRDAMLSKHSDVSLKTHMWMMLTQHRELCEVFRQPYANLPPLARQRWQKKLCMPSGSASVKWPSCQKRELPAQEKNAIL
eukprot:m.467352 g.467352  ORF g.467352 m.467352 type:complete len:135 (+) comp20364_c0_seq43:509-913(+)